MPLQRPGSTSQFSINTYFSNCMKKLLLLAIIGVAAVVQAQIPLVQHDGTGVLTSPTSLTVPSGIAAGSSTLNALVVTNATTLSGNATVGGTLGVTGTTTAGAVNITATTSHLYVGQSGFFNSRDWPLEITGPDSANIGMSLYAPGGGASFVMNSTPGTKASPTACSSGYGVSLLFETYDGSAFVYPAKILLGGGSQGFTTGNHNSIIQFYGTINNASSMTLEGQFDNTGNFHATTGNVIIDNLGSTLTVKGGSNSKSGTVVLTSGAGTISSTAITAKSCFVFGLNSKSGTIAGAPYITAQTAGTSATVAAGGSDNSTYTWTIIEGNQ